MRVLPPAAARRKSGAAPFRVAVALSAPLAALAGCAPDREPEVVPSAVIDDRGRPHDVSAPRTRVVSLIPAVTETLVAIGAADLLVARTRYDEATEVAELPSVGGGIDPSVEFLAALAPGLVVLWASGANGPRLEDRLDEIGVPWYGAALETVDDFRRHAGNLGRLVGLAERADSLIARVEEQLEAAAGSWAGRDPVRVVYVVQSDPPMTAGAGTFLDSVLDAAGAVNAFRDIRGNWPLVSMEEVVRRDPAYLIVPVQGYGTPVAPPGYRDPSAVWLAARPGWSAVAAVAAGRVISVDASLFGRPGPRMGEAAMYLASRLHGAG
ncbi:MAG: helical backbone metal receptor [Gemmatimonadota bacterium]|nr:helical backbone metal receptor [Gemmatimonadota bacterium]MDE2872365.1 helical backbone metal receptor [Gemmatimonadota bacterium]